MKKGGKLIYLLRQLWVGFSWFQQAANGRFSPVATDRCGSAFANVLKSIKIDLEEFIEMVADSMPVFAEGAHACMSTFIPNELLQ